MPNLLQRVTTLTAHLGDGETLHIEESSGCGVVLILRHGGQQHRTHVLAERNGLLLTEEYSEGDDYWSIDDVLCEMRCKPDWEDDPV